MNSSYIVNLLVGIQTNSSNIVFSVLYFLVTHIQVCRKCWNTFLFAE